MQGQKVLLGISGGIAAFKSLDICRLLMKKGVQVQVVMTENASRFVSPLTFRTITGHPVLSKLFDEQEKLPVPHVSLARSINAAVIAPATANLLGKLAGGIADNLLSTLLLALKCPVLIAPAMNGAMFRHPSVQENIAKLKNWGYHFISPGVGQLACGETDQGRMAEPEDIVSELEKLLARKKDLLGKTLLITAGPTREALDPVRYLSNYSSGKMGYSLATAASERGATVHLVSGPVSLKPPPGVFLHRVETAVEMREVVLNLSRKADAVIKAAAVADYRPQSCFEQKIKKEDDILTIVFEKNPDILLELGKQKEKYGYFLVGFAAETENLEQNALKKMQEKNLDLIVANDVSKPLSGFSAETNEIHLYHKNGEAKKFPLMTKLEAAHVILDQIKESLA